MAISTATVLHELDNLERDYRSAMEHHAGRGDDHEMRRCEDAFRKRLNDLERKYNMSNNMMGSILGGLGIADPNRYMQGNSGQLGQANNQSNAAVNQLMQNAAMPLTQQALQSAVPNSAKAEEGVLMYRGAPLPEKWMGAFYAMVNRVPVGKQWKISFNSEFSSDTIMLWLSMDEFSGNDADKVAATYLETINQRRLG